MKKTILLLTFLISSIAFAGPMKNVELENWDCSIKINGEEKCILYVRDIHNTTGLGLIYNAKDIKPETLPRKFSIRIESLKEFNQKNIVNEIFYTRLYYFAEVIEPKTSLQYK